MRTSVPLTEKQRRPCCLTRTTSGRYTEHRNRLRDSILDEDREEFDSTLKEPRHQLAELEALVSFNRA